MENEDFIEEEKKHIYKEVGSSMFKEEESDDAEKTKAKLDKSCMNTKISCFKKCHASFLTILSIYTFTNKMYKY